jgi:ribose-phosphate pyrophosphokinase
MKTLRFLATPIIKSEVDKKSLECGSLIVVSGSASPKLAARVAKELKCRLVKPEQKLFPDGELYVRLTKAVGREPIVIVQSTGYPQNDNLIELFLLLDTAKNLGAKKLTAVVPYLAYARQDKRFKPGEAVSLRTVLRLVERAGADELVTVDIHEENSIRNLSPPVKNLTAMPLLGRYLNRLNLRNPAVLGADQGAEKHAQRVAEEMGADYDYLEKKRITPTQVITRPRSLEVGERDIVIVDDIISTGGTLAEAAKILKRRGAREIRAACTHAVLTGNAVQILRAAGVKKIIATDTIERRESLISVASLIARALG